VSDAHSTVAECGPVGVQRFAAPAPHEPWTEVRDATRPGPTVPQPARDAFGVLDMSPYFGPGWVRGKAARVVEVELDDDEGPRSGRPRGSSVGLSLV
jgi:hypothetical protein